MSGCRSGTRSRSGWWSPGTGPWADWRREPGGRRWGHSSPGPLRLIKAEDRSAGGAGLEEGRAGEQPRGQMKRILAEDGTVGVRSAEIPGEEAPAHAAPGTGPLEGAASTGSRDEARGAEVLGLENGLPQFPQALQGKAGPGPVHAWDDPSLGRHPDRKS